MKNSVPMFLVGGFGFVGRNILEQIDIHEEFSGLRPIVIDDLSNAAIGHQDVEVDSFAGSYDTELSVSFVEEQGATDQGGRVFVFLAGETRVAESKDRPLDFIEANITAPSRFVMGNIQPGDKFILISTAGALFDGTTEIGIDSVVCPKNFYGASKAAEEMILEKLVELRGGQFSVVRMTNVYGRFSHKKKSAIHAFTRAALNGDQVTINGDGQQTRDFIYSGDVGYGIATLARRMVAGEETAKVNMLGSGLSVSLMDVVDAVSTATSKPLDYVKIPAKELISTEPRDVKANAGDVRALLGDKITSFAVGIQKTHEFYRDTNIG